jgi:hypothetical protein
MQKVTSFVDQAGIARNKDWLLGRRNGQGSFDLNPKALDTFGGAD